MCFWKGNHRGKTPFSFYHIKGTCYKHDLSLIMLTFTSLRLYWSNLSIARISLSLVPPLKFPCSLKGRVCPTLKALVLSSILQGEEVHKLFGILYRFVPPPHLPTQPFIYITMDSLIYFVHQGIIWYHFFWHSTCSSFGHSELLVWPLCYFVLLPLTCIVSTSLLPATIRWSK